CWVVESIPNEKVVTDYSKIISWVSKRAIAPVKEEFYDNRNNLKKLKNAQFTQVEDYWIFNKMTMENIKNQHKTEILIENIEINTGIDESIFDSKFMTRIR
ncbi:outer membrane lipoprotein-sorting protein, partial [candidate division KSB1 bacterium]